MTIASTTNRVTYTGNGVTTAFAFSYPFFADADLVVIETIIATGVQTTKTLTTHYTISGTTDSLGHYSSGGTVNAVTRTLAPDGPPGAFAGRFLHRFASADESHVGRIDAATRARKSCEKRARRPMITSALVEK